MRDRESRKLEARAKMNGETYRTSMRTNWTLRSQFRSPKIPETKVFAISSMCTPSAGEACPKGQHAAKTRKVLERENNR